MPDTDHRHRYIDEVYSGCENNGRIGSIQPMRPFSSCGQMKKRPPERGRDNTGILVQMLFAERLEDRRVIHCGFPHLIQLDVAVIMYDDVPNRFDRCPVDLADCGRTKFLRHAAA